MTLKHLAPSMHKHADCILVSFNVVEDQIFEENANNFSSRWLKHSLQKAVKNHFCLGNKTWLQAMLFALTDSVKRAALCLIQIVVLAWAGLEQSNFTNACV